MASNTNPKMITLKSQDGMEFQLSEKATMLSPKIRNVLEDIGSNKAIPVPNVTAEILKMVIEYCEKHAEAEDASNTETIEEGSSTPLGSSKILDEELKEWDKQFLDIDLDTIYDLLLAAHYLSITKLLNALSQKVADKIEGKSVEEIRQTFGMVNDFTAEQEEEIRKESPWAFD